MSRWKGLRYGLLLGCTITLMTSQPVFAAKGGNDESYTYTVTLYSGNQGIFSGTEGVQVDNHVTGSAYQISEPEQDGNRIYITGLQYGDMVMVSAQSCIRLEEDSRYYVGGVRESGHDNNTVGASAFQVEADREYVAAYGIKGDMVAYVVNYQDEAGNTLADSQTFYGTVGDTPVVAFRYIEDYQPQAYNLTKTLSSNEAENVFTFVYRQVSQGAANGKTPGNTAGGGTTGGEAAGTNGNANNAGNADGNTGDAGNTGNAPNAGNNGNTDNNGNAAGNADNAGNAEDNLVTDEDEQVPQDLINLDDEETPLANIGGNKAKDRPFGNMLIFVGISVAALAGLAGVLAAGWKMRVRKIKAQGGLESGAESEKAAKTEKDRKKEKNSRRDV